MAGAVAAPSKSVASVDSLSSQDTSQAFKRLFARIANAGEAVRESELDEALALAARGRIWSSAVQLLRLPNVTPTREHYHMAIVACRNADHKWEPALALLEEMESRGLAPNVTTYNEVMSICATCQKAKETVGVLDKMVKASMPMSISSFNIAVQALAREKQWRKAVKMVQYMEKQAIWPDTVTYTAAISACGRAGEWQKALLLLEDMVKKSVAPTVETYNAVMDGCRRGNQGERAVAFLEEMRRKKLPIDTRSFTIAIGACEALKKVDTALELWEGLPSEGFTPEVATLEALANVLARKKQWDKLKKVVEGLPTEGAGVLRHKGALILAKKMQAGGSALDAPLAKFVLRALLDGGREGEALGLALQGVGADVSDDAAIQALHTILSLRAKGRKNAKARKAGLHSGDDAKLKPAQGPEGDKPADAQWQEISALCESGRLVGAADALLASAGGRKPRPSLVNLVLEYCVVKRDLAAAKRMLVGSGRAVYNRVLRVAASLGAWSEVSQLLKDMEMKGIEPDAGSYLELIQGAREAGNLTRVRRYHLQMLDKGLSLGEEHIVSLMGAYQEADKTPRVLALAKEAGELLVKGDPQIATRALEACASAGLVEDALEFERRLGAGSLDPVQRALVLVALAEGGAVGDLEKRVAELKAGGSLDAPAVDALIRAYARQGNADKALETLRALKGGQYGAGARPSEMSYVLVMQGLSKAGRFEEVPALLDSVELPSAEAFSLAVNALARAGKPGEALEVLGRMVQQGVAYSARLEKTLYKCCLDMGASAGLAKLRDIAAR